MTDEQRVPLRRYFLENSAWNRQLAQLRKKSAAGYANGKIVLKDATPAECTAAGAFLGKHFVAPHVSYSMLAFQSALAQSVFSLPDLAAFWQALDGTAFVTNKDQKACRDAAIENFFAEEKQQAHGQIAVDWLNTMAEQHMCGYFLLLPLLLEEPQAAKWLHWVCCAVDRLSTRDTAQSLAVCSTEVTSDPHAFDNSHPAGRLLVQALACWQEVPVPTTARQRRQLLRQCGLYMDDISCSVAQKGLFLFDGDEEHPAYAAFRQRNELCLLTSMQISAINSVKSFSNRVYVMENELLFSQICRSKRAAQPMICTSGQFKEAAWMLLDLLAEGNCEIWYSGDFDPEGMSICDRLWQTYPGSVHPWHMAPEDYQLAVSQKEISPERMAQLNNIKCPQLQDTANMMQTIRCAGYQEALLEIYCEDLSRV